MSDGEDIGFAEEFAFKPAAVKRSASNRGKVAEGELSKAFKKLKAESKHFDYEKVPDAFSSRGGFLLPRTGDFQVYYRGQAVIVECKEVKHDFRLPAKNLDGPSRERMARRVEAGIPCMVLVYFSTRATWRWAPIAYFGTRTLGSWDMRELQTFSNSDIIKEVLNVCLPSSTTSTLALTVQLEPL